MFQFPASPTVGQLFTPVAGVTFRWNGTAWFLVSSAFITQTDGDARYVQISNVIQNIPVACSDETTALTTGTAKVTFRMPYAFTLTKIKGSLTVASTSGLPTVDVKKNGTSVFSTLMTFDANEKTTATAATPSVLTATPLALADDDEITIDITVAGTGAKGLKIYLIGRPT